MYGILEEFYYGNIDPQMREVNKNSKLYKMIFRMEEIEARLLNTLEGEEKEMFATYVDLANQTESASSLDRFLVGFRLGAKFTYDTFVREDAPYADSLKWIVGYFLLRCLSPTGVRPRRLRRRGRTPVGE